MFPPGMRITEIRDKTCLTGRRWCQLAGSGLTCGGVSSVDSVFFFGGGDDDTFGLKWNFPQKSSKIYGEARRHVNAHPTDLRLAFAVGEVPSRSEYHR